MKKYLLLLLLAMSINIGYCSDEDILKTGHDVMQDGKVWLNKLVTSIDKKYKIDAVLLGGGYGPNHPFTLYVTFNGRFDLKRENLGLLDAINSAVNQHFYEKYPGVIDNITIYYYRSCNRVGCPIEAYQTFTTEKLYNADLHVVQKIHPMFLNPI